MMPGSTVYVASIDSYEGHWIVGVYTTQDEAWRAANEALVAPAFSDERDGISGAEVRVEPHVVDAAAICEWRAEKRPPSFGKHDGPPPWSSPS